MLSEIKQNKIEYFLRNMFCFQFARALRLRSFSINFAISIYISKNILSKKLICSIAVLRFCLKPLEYL